MKKKKLIRPLLLGLMLLGILSGSFFIGQEEAQAAEYRTINQWRMMYIGIWPSTTNDGTWFYVDNGKTYRFKPSVSGSSKTYTVPNLREDMIVPAEFRNNPEKYKNISYKKRSIIPNVNQYTDPDNERFEHPFSLYKNWYYYMYVNCFAGNAYYDSQWISSRSNEYIFDKIQIRLNSSYAEKINNNGLRFYVPFAIEWQAEIVENRDVAVSAINPTSFKANQTATATVTLRNNDTEAITTPVNFQIAGVINQNKNITLNAGQSKTLDFSFTAPSGGSFTMTAEANQDRSFSEKDYSNNKLSVIGSIMAENDVAVTKITPTSYPANQGVLAEVTVQNLGTTAVSTDVNFCIAGIINQTEAVTLNGGQSKVIKFCFTTPSGGTVTMIAEVNKNRTLTEKDYTNNKKTVNAVISGGSGGINSTICSDILKWTETASHIVSYPCENHGSHSYECIHIFQYEAELTTSYSIAPKTFKSGYGFEIIVNNSVSTRLVSNTGGCSSWGNNRAATKKVTPPSRVEIRLPWKVVNQLGTQPYTIQLAIVDSDSTSSKFEASPNPISELRAKKIYTPVDLAGTKTAPKVHYFDIYISGGGVNGVEFCKTIRASITINGDMYEDDITGGSK